MRADRPRRPRSAAALAGLLLLAAQAAALPLLLARCQRDPLSVRVPPGPAVAPTGAFLPDGKLPPSLADRARLTIDDRPAQAEETRLSPGLHRVSWQIDYRGGFRRRAGTTVLAGPFQDPAHPPCGLTARIGQRFLDETLAPIAQRLVTEGLEGVEHWSIGRFAGVSDLRLDWLGLPGLPGQLHIAMTLRFTRAEARIAVAAAPAIVDGKLRVRPSVDARVILKNWFVRTGARALSYLDIFDKDDEATAQVEAEVAAAISLVESLALPELDLPGGKVAIIYCPDRPITIATRDHAAVPLALRLPPSDRGAPVQIGGPPPPEPAGPLPASFALEADLDALNALLHHLWATGSLDELLTEERAAELFNMQPAVQELLTLRVAHLSFSLPPVLERGGERSQTAFGLRPLSIAAEVNLDLDDGATRIPAHLFGRLAFELHDWRGAIVLRTLPNELVEDLARSIALTCEPTPGLLEPCFADVVDAVIDQIRVSKQAVHGWATARFAKTFGNLANRFRFEAPEVSFGFRITGLDTTTTVDQARIRVLLEPVPAATKE